MLPSIFKRELCSESSRGSSGVHRACSTSLVHRLEKIGTLDGHNGCVNTVAFSPDGGTLLSGSDDLRIIYWDWQRGCQRLAYESGHRGNVFQARVIPGSDLHVVVSCAADGQVRVGHLRSNGTVETRQLTSHQGRAHKLALDARNDATFYSCGEDGAVRHFDLREKGAASRKLLLCRASRHGQTGKIIELNSIACNPLRPWQFAVAGGDEYVRIYDQRRTHSGSAGASLGRQSADMALPVRKLAPQNLREGRRVSHITCATFSASGEVLATYNDENIYLFAAEGAAVRQGGRHRTASPVKRRRSAGGSEAGGPVGGKQFRTSGQQPMRLLGSQEPLLLPTPPPPPPDSPPHASTPGCSGGHSADPDSRERFAASAVEGSQRGTPAADAAVGGEEERGDPGDADPEQHLVSRSRDAVEEREPVLAHMHFEAARAAGQLHRGSLQTWIEDSDLRAQAQRLMSMRDETTAGPQGPHDTDESPEAQHHASLWRRRRRNAIFIPPAGAGLESDSEGELEVDGDWAGTMPEGDEGGVDHVIMKFTGHRNTQTVKGCAFAGAGDELVMSGSDCGHLFIWDKRTGALQQWQEADRDVLNCLEQHPTLPLTIATSGIDPDVKLWAPTALEAQPPSRVAQKIMVYNRQQQGPAGGMGARMVLQPHMMAQLRRLNRMAFGSPDARGRVNAEEAEHREDVTVEEESSEEESSNDEEDWQQYTDGDCVIA